MSSQQHFERLIRLEDEELVSNEDNYINEDSGISDNDQCKVPMISNGNQSDVNQESLEAKHRQGRSLNHNVGFHFIINGRRIQMNPEQLKYLSLVTLTVQNAALSLVMRAARTQKEQFSSSMAVTVAEFLKFVTCLALVWYEEFTVECAYRTIKTHIFVNYLDTLKVAVPSFVYYVQNNLLYVGSTHLDAATAQITYQLKILTTGVFSVVMLNKKLSKIQWVSLVVLFLGVAMIETIVVSNNHNNTTNTTTDHSESVSSNYQHAGAKSDISRDEKPLIGFLAILTACCLSGFAGVYFEKILKNTSHVSLWIRNIQLSLVAIPIGLVQVIVLEYDELVSKGPLHGFTATTWLCIFLQAIGGLLVAVVVKFANNILKGFATSLSIVISTVASIFIFNFNLTPTFIFGAGLVMGSVMMYNK